MLGKLSVLLLLCQIAVFSYGGVLPSSRPSEETCSGMYVSCSVTDDKCCSPLRCLDFGSGNPECLYGTDSPFIPQVGNAVQPPVDLIHNLGCGLYAESCNGTLDCCAPYVCSEKTCKNPPADPFGFGGYGGYGGYPGNPGK